MSAARDLAKLGNTEVFTVDTAGGKVGVDSTSPVGEFQVGAAITVGSLSGIISATAFYGDGSNLDGVSSAGLGTALSETDGDAAKLIYYTDSTLGIGSTVNVIVPTGSDVAYTQYTEIAPEENVDFIVADGDDFIPDILGISTVGGSTLTGPGGRIRAGSITNRAADGAPQLTYGAEVLVGYGITGAGGVNISGFATAGGFVGNLTGDVTGNASGTAGGLSGAPDVDLGNISAAGGDLTIRNITGVAATFTGTLTYEDVTNIDAVGFVTFQKGAIVQGAGSTTTTLNVTGVSTLGVTSVSTFTAKGTLIEGMSSTTTAYSSSSDLNITNGNFQFSSANLGGTNNTLNIMSTTGINTDLATNQVMNVTAVTACNASTAYVNRVSIDGLLTGITTHWVGGSEPSDGGGSGVDTYSFNVLKTGNLTYIVIANQVKTSS